MNPPALCQSHPEAAAELGLWAIFAACEANKAALAQARQAQADRRLAGRRFWWREGEDLMVDGNREATSNTIHAL